MIITISGLPGSGKSTNAKMLAEALGYKLYSIGNMRREMARRRGLTLEQYNALGERDFSTDREVDEYQKKLGATEDNFVVDGRTSFYFIPQSFKVFLSCDIQVAAERIWRQIQAEPNHRDEASGLHSLEDLVRTIRHRIESDTRRYETYYQLNVYDLSHYDVVIDSSQLTPAEVHEKLLETVHTYVARTTAP